MKVLKKSMTFMAQKNVFIGLVLMALARGLREGWECCVTIGPGFSFCHEILIRLLLSFSQAIDLIDLSRKAAPPLALSKHFGDPPPLDVYLMCDPY